MTKQRLSAWVYAVMGVYTLAIVEGVFIKVRFSDVVYQTYKDLLPFVIAVPAAWLGYCFQRRSSYLQALRALFKDLITSVNKAVEYTRWETPPSEKDFREAVESLSISIDSVRGVFKNIPRINYPLGLYPYENLKEIRRIIGWLGFNDNWSKEKKKAHKCIATLWAEMHSALLEEFDTEIPIIPVSKYLTGSPSLADMLLNGKLTDDDFAKADEERDTFLLSIRRPWWQFWPTATRKR